MARLGLPGRAVPVLSDCLLLEGDSLVSARSRFDIAIELLDAAHAEDPNQELIGGEEHAAELLYAQRMSSWLQRVAPEASEALRLAVRSQHLRRWSLPRDAYPAGKAGYHRWRREQGRQQAETAARILAQAGYESELCERVASLVRKENLRSDGETQALEDTACLVFLQYYFRDFAAGHSAEKLIGIVRKTWNKMSARGQELALTLPFTEDEQALLGKALAAEEG